MAMRVIAEAESVEEFRTVQPTVNELPKGTRGRVEMQGWGIGPPADLWGAELVADWLGPSGAIIIDVYGEGWDKAVIVFEADPIWVPVLAVAIAVFLVAIGLAALITSIKMSAELAREFKWIPIAIGATAVAGLALVLWSRKRAPA